MWGWNMKGRTLDLLCLGQVLAAITAGYVHLAKSPDPLWSGFLIGIQATDNVYLLGLLG